MWVRKASNVTRGFQKNPTGRLQLRKEPVLCFIDSSAAVWRQSGSWIFQFLLLFGLALYRTSQGVSPDISLSRNKQSYYWVRQASDRKSMPGALETSSDSPLFTSDCHASLFFREYDCCLTLNVITESIDSLAESLNSHYCACKWEFMFCYWLRMLKTDRLKYVQ